MEAYVGVEGFTLPCGYIIKELAIFYTNDESDHFLFEKPGHELRLSVCDKRTIRYVTQHLNMLSYNDGSIPYSQIEPILKRLMGHTIYTYGLEAKRWILKHLPTSMVVNTQELGHKLPNTLPDPKCFRQHSCRYYTKAKAISVKKFIEIGE